MITAPPPLPPQTAPAILQVIRAEAADPSDDGITLTLSPEELGPLHLRLITEGDSLRIAFTVERPETLDLLRRHADQFAQDLRQSGFASASFSFAGGGAETPPRPPPQTGAASHPEPAFPPPPPSNSPQAGLDLRL